MNRSQIYAVAATFSSKVLIRTTPTRMGGPSIACIECFGKISEKMTVMPLGGNRRLVRTIKWLKPRLDQLEKKHLESQEGRRELLVVEFDQPIPWRGEPLSKIA